MNVEMMETDKCVSCMQYSCSVSDVSIEIKNGGGRSKNTRIVTLRILS